MKPSVKNLLKRLPQAQLGAFRPGNFVGLLALAAPVAYVIGRTDVASSTDAFQSALSQGLWLSALGVLLGIPVGLYFGTNRATPASSSTLVTTSHAGGTAADVMRELATELGENQQLFAARKGKTEVVARLGYVTSYWDTAKAAGRLFVIEDAHLLSQIALAYYWLDQANHVETLAYNAKNSGQTVDAEYTTARLISEARLLDEPLEAALAAAVAAIGKAQQTTARS